MTKATASVRIAHESILDAAFAGTLWKDDDPEARANPTAAFLDLWGVDMSPPSSARAVLTPGSLSDLAHFLSVSPEQDPLLVIDSARNGLASVDYVRNTAPDLMSASLPFCGGVRQSFPVMIQTLLCRS